MFGIGYQEMLLIGLAALLLFGPGKLPEVMSQAGKWYKQFRDITGELSGEFNKTIAEAKGELDSLGVDLGPMQQQLNSINKSVQKDLGGKKTTTTGKKATTSSTAKKTGTTTGAKSSTTSSARTSAARSSATKTSSSPAAKPNMTSGKPVVVASKEDPFAGISLFEEAERKPVRRARSATPSIFSDLTPRDAAPDGATDTAVRPAMAAEPIAIDPNDPIARARRRRITAGYTQATA